MAWKTLLVHVGNGEAAAARLALACGLADRFGAALIGVSALAPRAAALANPMIGAAAIADPMEAERQRIEAELRAAEDRFRAAVGPHRAAAWRAFVESPAPALAREARSADLLVLGREPEGGGGDDLRFPATGDVLLAAGRPVLFVPPGVAALAARRVVVGWRDTREARRAVADALPLLAGAEALLVLEICEEEDRLDAARRATEEVARHLGRHGARAEARAQARREATVANDLVHAAERAGADLIVAGGYGHARISEWVFGGVTRDLLRRCPVACLLSH